MKPQIPDLVLYETIEKKFTEVLSEVYLLEWSFIKRKFNYYSLYPDFLMNDDLLIVGLIFENYIIVPQDFVNARRTILKVNEDCYSFYMYIYNFLIFKKDEIYVTNLRVEYLKRYKE